MSLTTYTKLVSELIVASRTSQFEEAQNLTIRVREVYSELNEIEKERSKAIVSMLTMYHNQ